MATIINNLCCSAATRRNHNPALHSSCNNITATIPFASSFHLSTKLPTNRFRNFHLLEAKTAKEEVVEDYYEYLNQSDEYSPNNNKSNSVIMAVAAALTVGVAVLLIDDQKAMALGPEGPLAEEFWENMRRYALYALTVSTGVAYAVFQPIYELLRNPISAILIIAIAVGGFYLVSQVLSAMVGVSDFNYQYSY